MKTAAGDTQHLRKRATLLALLPIAVVGAYVLLFGVNIPFWDQWAVVPLLAKQMYGTLTVADLFAQQNETRPFFPRLIWLTLAPMTAYDVRAELWLNLGLALITFAFFLRETLRTWARLRAAAPAYMIPLMSLLVFNLGQRESWLQGYQSVMFLALAAATIGLLLLAGYTRWPAFGIALLLGILATFSVVNGMLYWPIGLAVIAATTSGRVRCGRLLLWMLVSSACMGLFFTGWSSDAGTSVRYGLSHPVGWVVWLLSFLGSPIMTAWYVAWAFGAASIALYAWVIVRTARSGEWRLLAGYFAVAAFVVLTALAASVGRLSLGLPQSSVSRYLTTSVWYWMSLLALVPILPIKTAHRQVGLSLLAAVLVVLTVVGGWRGYVSLYQRIQPAYAAAHAGRDLSDALLTNIYPDPQWVRPQLEFLCEQHLSACRTP